MTEYGLQEIAHKLFETSEQRGYSISSLKEAKELNCVNQYDIQLLDRWIDRDFNDSILYYCDLLRDLAYKILLHAD
jgi:hypothetical protein